MSVCEPHLLSAYLDGELVAADRERVEAHLAQCPKCATELQSLRELSASIASYPFDNIRPDELSRLHDAIHHAAADTGDATIFRIGGTIGLIAASILVVAGTWLATLPAPSQQPAQGRPAAIAEIPAWERVATTLQVDPPRQADDPVYLA